MSNSPIVARINGLLAEKVIPKQKFYEDCGITSASYSLWNKGKTTPRMKNLENIAQYLGTTTEYLLTGIEETKKAPTDGERDHAIDHVDEELKDYLDELRNRSEMRMLFSVARNANKQKIEAIVKFIEGLEEQK